MDIKHHKFAPIQADDFLLLDLREPQNCRAALTLRQPFDWAQGRRRSGHRFGADSLEHQWLVK